MYISTDFGTITYYSIKPQSISLQTYSGNTFDITIVSDAMANFNPRLVIPDFDFVLNGQSITISGTVNLSLQGTGYKIVFAPTGITYNNNNWLKPVIQHQLDGMKTKLPEISTSSNQPLLPMPTELASYFISGTPTLTTTTTDVILGLTLAVGPRWITAQNEANQRIDLGKIQEVQNGTAVSTFDSPHTFDTWYTNDVKQVQSRDALVASTNGQNKYKNWFDQKFPNTPLPDIASRRIQLTVGSGDATYSAKFPQAQRVQLSNLLEGSYSGGTVTYESTTGATFDDYDYQHPTQTHPINTSVSNGILGLNWNFMGWSDGNANQSRNIVLSNDVNLAANYKATSATSINYGFAGGSQRKIVRTTEPALFMVYESMGAIWSQISFNDGYTWDYITKVSDNAKQPSLCVWGENAVIVYQKQNESVPTHYNIVARMLSSDASMSSEIIIYDNNEYGVPLYSDDAQPVVAINPNGKTIFAWRQTSNSTNAGIYYSTGTLTSEGDYNESVAATRFGESNSSSINPSVAASSIADAGGHWHFPLVWIQGSDMFYHDVEYRANGSWDVHSYSVASSGSGYTQHYTPSVVAYGATGGYIACVGRRWESGGISKAQAGGGGTYKYRTIVKDLSASTFSVYGDNVSTVTVNKNTSGTTDQSYAVAWSYNSGTSTQYRLNNGQTGYFRNSGITINGRDVQLANGTSFGNMRGGLLDGQTTAPYRIKLSDHDLTQMAKEQTTAMYYGREGIVRSGSGEFYFALGDIAVDGVGIEFFDTPDTVKTFTQSKLNTYLMSNTFQLTNSSSFEYSVQYGITDSASCAAALEQGKQIQFKVQLIDAQTEAVLGEFDDVTFSSTSLDQYRNIGYQVDTKGIGTKTVRLKLIVSSFDGCEYSLSNRENTGSILGYSKNGVVRHQVSYKGLAPVTTYALEQNYPNPFNPSTTIDYQIPNDGHVMMKVYDVLGKEVATLVNEQKSLGRYSAIFDGSHLASGTYIVRMISRADGGSSKDEFVKTMKVMLMK